MDFDFQTETITPVLSTILSISSVGALLLPVGTTAQQPVGQAGLIRFNTSLPNLEYHNGTTWVQSSSIASITVTGSTGLTVGGSPLTSSGTITLTLGTELQGLSALATSGIVTRTAAGTYTGRTITGTTSNILVANGDGIAGNPTIDLATAGTAVAAGFVKITTDAYGRVTRTGAAPRTVAISVEATAVVAVTRP